MGIFVQHYTHICAFWVLVHLVHTVFGFGADDVNVEVIQFGYYSLYGVVIKYPVLVHNACFITSFIYSAVN